MNYKRKGLEFLVALLLSPLALNTTAGKTQDATEWNPTKINASWYTGKNAEDKGKVNKGKIEDKIDLNWIKHGDELYLKDLGQSYLIARNPLVDSETLGKRYWKNWECLIKELGVNTDSIDYDGLKDGKVYLIPGPSFTQEEYNQDSTKINEEILKSAEPYFPNISIKNVSIKLEYIEITKERLEESLNKYSYLRESPDWINAVRLVVAKLSLDGLINTSSWENKANWIKNPRYDPRTGDRDGSGIANIVELKDKAGKVVGYGFTCWHLNGNNI